MLEIDIWRSGQSMIDMYGDKAENQAALKIKQLLERGDTVEAGVWKQISTAITVLRVAAPSEVQVEQ
jgi:hypothetical protein